MAWCGGKLPENLAGSFSHSFGVIYCCAIFSLRITPHRGLPQMIQTSGQPALLDMQHCFLLRNTNIDYFCQRVLTNNYTLITQSHFPLTFASSLTFLDGLPSSSFSSSSSPRAVSIEQEELHYLLPLTCVPLLPSSPIAYQH